jgi:hypothetical protein
LMVGLGGYVVVLTHDSIPERFKRFHSSA